MFRLTTFINFSIFYFISFFNIFHTNAQINVIQHAAQEWPPGWTEKCIGCICDASSSCNQTIGCIEGYCGMFLISKQYWVDAESPTLLGDDVNRPGAFERCANDSYCASRAVNQYIQKYLQDCNKDGRISCDDYARLHYYGHKHCTFGMNDISYYNAFRSCFSII